MKFYRLRDKKWGGKYFLSVSEEDMKHQVEYRNEPNEFLQTPATNNWYYDTVEIDNDAVGICWNNFPSIKTPSLLTTPYSPMCSVGMVRSERSGDRVRTDDIIEDENDKGVGLLGVVLLALISFRKNN